MRLMNTETKICQNCQKTFTIEPEDFKFYKKFWMSKTALLIITFFPFTARATVRCFDYSWSWLEDIVGWPIRAFAGISYGFKQIILSLSYPSYYLLFGFGIILNLIIFYLIGLLLDKNEFVSKYKLKIILPTLYLLIVVILLGLWYSGFTCLFP